MSASAPARTRPAASRSPLLVVGAIALLVLYLLLLPLMTAVLAAVAWTMFHLGVISGLILAIAGVCIALIVTMWVAAVPRRAPEPPGVLVNLQYQPELRQAVQEVARKMNTPMPDEVRLLPEMNAYASERGWLKRTTTLGLGYPLLTMLPPDEVKAVVAHELGHLQHGDARLGWRLSGFRQSLIRTVQAMHQGGKGGENEAWVIGLYRLLAQMMSLPFLAIAQGYIALTSRLSHAQEHAADAQAERVAGKVTMDRALQNVALNARLFDAYIVNYVQPAAGAGYQVPLAQGFLTYLGGPEAREQRQHTAQAISDTAEEASLSHPSLRARLGSGADQVAAGKAEELALPEKPLLRNAEPLTAHFYGTGKGSLRPITWEKLGEKFWPEFWRQSLVSRLPETMLKDVYISHVADVCGNLDRHMQQRFPELRKGMGQRERYLGGQLLTVGLLHAATAQGWAAEVRPGYPARLSRGEVSFEPETLVYEMMKSEESRAGWIPLIRGLGLPDAPLLPPSRYR